jgi:hypothetical protein
MLLELDKLDAIPRARIPVLITVLAARLLEPEPAPEPVEEPDDRMLTAAEASKILRRSLKWISRHRNNLPFARRLGPRSWVYSEKGLRRWLARQK